MAKSTRDITKQRKPRAPVTGTPVVVRMQPGQLTPLDAWIAAQPDPKPSRPEAIRYALTDWLTGLGYVPRRVDSEGAN